MSKARLSRWRMPRRSCARRCGWTKRRRGGDLDGDAFSGRLSVLLRWLHRVGGMRHLKPERVEEALNNSGDARYQALLRRCSARMASAYKFQLAKAKRDRLSEAEVGALRGGASRGGAVDRGLPPAPLVPGHYLRDTASFRHPLWKLHARLTQEHA